MDDKLNVEESGLGLNVEPQEENVIYTPPVDENELGRIDELPEEEVDSFDELDKKNYHKVSPTFYVRGIGVEEVDGEEVEMFKILNPETETVETRPLTEAELKEIFVLDLKQSKKVFHPTKHPVKTVGKQTVVNFLGNERQVKERAVATNITENKYGPKYKQHRKRKNTLAKRSRRANRK